MSYCLLAALSLFITLALGVWAESRLVNEYNAIHEIGGRRWWEGGHPKAAWFFFFKHFAYRDGPMSVAIVLAWAFCLLALYLFDSSCALSS
jgi:hypothetical protein